jgi:spore coat protein H
MRRRVPAWWMVRLALCVLAIWAAALERPAAQAPTAADLFDDRTLQEIRLSINSKDLGRLRARFDLNTFYPADLTWNNIRVRNVGVRSRGSGSRNGQKLGLLVDLDRYTTGQRFLGLSSLVLDNVFQDASLMRETLAMSMFRRLGVPAPREAFCRVFINNIYQGLYAVVEPIDTTFTQRTLGQSTGFLFEYHHIRRFFAEFLGEDLATYEPMFEPQNHELDAASTLWGPIREMFREINGPDDAVWRGRVEERVDMAQVIRYVAIEAFLGESDGFLGFAGMNNFYLYRDAGTGRHRLLPWDKDFAFEFRESSLFDRTEENVLVRRALAEPDLRAAFLDGAEEAARSADEDGFLAALVDRYIALITVAVLEDTRKQFSNEAFSEATEKLRLFAATRSALVLDEVARSR